MWLRSHVSVFLILFLESLLLLNGSVSSASSDSGLESSLLSRVSTWDCSSDTDCTISNSSCVDGYCECAGGYMYNANMTSCILVATAYGDSCTEILQCSTYLLTGGVCEDSVCTCGDGYHYIHGRCYASSGLGEACEADVNCYVNADNEATSCVDGVCVCSDGFYQREYRTCRRGGYSEGDECAVDIDCQFENGVCNSSYVCTYDTTVNTTTTRLDVEGRVTRSLGRDDENATVGTECVSNDNCSTLANSKCGAAGTCICNRAYFASSDLSTCVPEIGEECSDDDDVTITNSLCRNGTWSCGYSTVTSLTQKICRKTTKVYNYSCLWDEQCYIFGPDASCQSKRCLCDEGSHWVEEELFCWVNKGIGESCQADEDCYVEDLDVELSCSNSVCTCPNGTSANSDNTLCKSDNAELGDVCEEDSDCTAANSVCVDLVCTCPDYYYEVDEACAAGINATCSSDSDCSVANSTCTDDLVCACGDDFVSDESTSCLPVATYGESCESDIQCSTTLSNTYCAVVTSTTDAEETNTTSCDCESDYHYSYGACYLKSAIGDSCSTLADCYVETGSEYVVCRSGVCACTWDATASSTTACVISTSDAASFFLSTWLGLILLSVKICLV
ncbi:prion-like-(Q/N-rich) domain-bearing protein 25 isoform X1 [Neodiprion lecontei]|uniref:Prion-like-(Q/N-rich) domain-bearing protein 25 isoform X1 n=1 Tax=Neodiprion lecontei TaxID=441921 RepID=A0A6J0C8A7_NEOLC|nr:prion-like-(Q/N-rich) domain-bearing protein 25 isoform X1 [Neodiprion lecontei]